MMAAMVQASATSDPDFPLLTKYATGEALVTLRYSLQASRLKGLVSKGPMRMAPRVESVTADGLMVRISDCVDDSEWLRYRQDGSLPGGAPGGRRSTTAEVITVDGAWKVSVLRISETETC